MPVRDKLAHRGHSGNLDVFYSSNAGLLARNQAQQDAPDRVKLCGVNERVGSDVEKRDGQKRVSSCREA